MARPSIVVVGAGIIGASITWHLTAAGADVTVIDAGEPGGVATPNSFAWINASWGNPEPYFRLRIRSMAGWHRLAEAVPAIPLGWTGGLCWDLPPAQLHAYAAQHAAWGYGIRSVDRAEAAQIEPNLIDLPDFALHVAEEGAVEPRLAALALLADAQRHGARVLPATRASSLVQRNGRVVGVQTDTDRLDADEVVVAAGVGTPELVGTADLHLAIDSPPGLIVHSVPHRRLLNGLVLSPGMHLRQTAEGRVIAGADFSGADPGKDPAIVARALFDRMKSALRDADDLRFGFHTIGYRPTPADSFPAIGRISGRAGLYVAVMHSGITLAPAVGQFVAQELLTGNRDPLLMPYDPSRFEGRRPLSTPEAIRR